MLLAPTESDTRCSLADWLELNCILSPRRVSSRADLLNVFEIADDDRDLRFSHDDETGEELDQGILDEPRTALLNSAFEEVAFRAASLGESYPFQVDALRMVLRASFRTDAVHHGQVAYTFCLLASAIRERTIAGMKSLVKQEKSIPIHFQVCACLAAAGYFGGAVSSFGFPRAEGTAFLPALRSAFARFGHGEVRSKIDPGHPQAAKDGGIDVIAWRDHPDRLPAKLYSLGQCASGKNWTQKPVTSEIAQFHTTWFSVQPAAYCVPALYIPFVTHGDLEEPEGHSYEAARTRNVAYHETKFGVIFDRLRIAHHADVCMGTPSAHSRVDGVDRAADVAHWVNQTIGRIMKKGAMV
jgi:hypothetical protein